MIEKIEQWFDKHAGVVFSSRLHDIDDIEQL